MQNDQLKTILTEKRDEAQKKLTHFELMIAGAEKSAAKLREEIAKLNEALDGPTDPGVLKIRGMIIPPEIAAKIPECLKPKKQ